MGALFQLYADGVPAICRPYSVQVVGPFGPTISTQIKRRWPSAVDADCSCQRARIECMRESCLLLRLLPAPSRHPACLRPILTHCCTPWSGWGAVEGLPRHLQIDAAQHGMMTGAAQFPEQPPCLCASFVSGGPEARFVGQALSAGMPMAASEHVYVLCKGTHSPVQRMCCLSFSRRHIVCVVLGPPPNPERLER